LQDCISARGQDTRRIFGKGVENGRWLLSVQPVFSPFESVANIQSPIDPTPEMDSNSTSPVSLSPSTPRSLARSEAGSRSPLSPSRYLLDEPPLDIIYHTNNNNNNNNNHIVDHVVVPDSLSVSEPITAPTKPNDTKPNAAVKKSKAVEKPKVNERKMMLADVEKTVDVEGDDEAALVCGSTSASASASALTSTSASASTSPAVSLKEYDENGMRTVVDYYINELGQYIKRTRVMRLVKKQVQVNKKVMERRQWSKFGDCSDLPPGPEPNITSKSSDLIHLNLRPKFPSPDGLEYDTKTNNNASAAGGGGGGGGGGVDQKNTFAAILGQNEGKVVVCSNCGEPGHWSLKCPKRSSRAPPTTTSSSDNPSLDKPAAAPPTNNNGVYIPSYLRNKPEYQQQQQQQQQQQSQQTQQQHSQWDRNEGPSVRVTNLSENASENDLRELCRPFGHVTRVYLAKDQVTRKSRGFAFVTFEHKEDGQRAIDRLHRHPYDNLLLAVEWAKPRLPSTTNTDSNITNAKGNNTAAGAGSSSSSLPPKRKTYFSNRSSRK
jgi:translation initiation factor 3 subunit G